MKLKFKLARVQKAGDLSKLLILYMAKVKSQKRKGYAVSPQIDNVGTWLAIFMEGSIFLSNSLPTKIPYFIIFKCAVHVIVSLTLKHTVQLELSYSHHQPCMWGLSLNCHCPHMLASGLSRSCCHFRQFMCVAGAMHVGAMC